VSRLHSLAGPAVAVLVGGALLAAALLAPPASRLRRPARVTALVTDAGASALRSGLDRLGEEDPALARALDLAIRSPAASGERAPTAVTGGAEAPGGAALEATDLVLVELMDPGLLARHERALASLVTRTPRPPVIGFGPRPRATTDERLTLAGVRPDPLLDPYWTDGGPREVASFLRLALKRWGGRPDLLVPTLTARPAEGFVWWDDAGKSHLLESYAAWEALARPPQGRPLAAVIEARTRARREDLGVARALAVALEREGLTPLVVFGHPGSAVVEHLLLDAEGRPRVACAVAFQWKFADPDAERALERLGVPVLNGIRVFGRTLDEWRASSQGLTTGEVAWQLALPELAGLAQPTVVAANVGRAGGDGAEVRAIPERVTRAARRAAAWARLQSLPFREKRIALLYWNYPPGKQNVGASYLGVVRSIPMILKDLHARGYDVGGAETEDARAIERVVLARGRNVGRYAPGEVAALAAHEETTRLPISVYRSWYADAPRALRARIEAHWGPPEAASIMSADGAEGRVLLLPIIRRGNVSLLVQPDRARTQDLAALYQSQELPPHHQYLAAYLYLQKELRADAVIHLGTHGTHEWLSGKESGQDADDPGEALAGALPILYPYIMDDVAEGIVAKRRGAATVVSHLTPALGQAGLAPELQALRRRIEERREALARGSDAAAAEIAEAVFSEAKARGLDRDLGWEAVTQTASSTRSASTTLAASTTRAASTTTLTALALEARLDALFAHLDALREEAIPFGLHTFGVSPAGATLAAFVDLVVEANGPASRTRAAEALAASGAEELRSLARGLEGRRVRAGPGNDPVRNPAALPTGTNFYAFDPRTIPTEAAERTGARLAEALVASHARDHGAPPRKVALQLWGVETVRHAGVQEAQALALLGVRCVRDREGRVTGLERVPRAALGRPRVDVVLHATSLYRDNFPGLVELLDRAVRVAADTSQEPSGAETDSVAGVEPDNALAAHVRALEAALLADGFPSEEAARRARVRIFAEPAGMHSSKVAEMATASGSWDTEAQVAETWIRRMGHGYGGGLWGASLEREFRAALAGTDAIVHSQSSRLYGTLDNDDFFSYGGSIALGVRRANGGGASPPFWISDLRTAGREAHVPLARYLGSELRSRLLNPAWAAAMRDEGYAGAREVWKSTEFLWGWTMVAPEAVGDAKWSEMFDFWIEDRAALGLEAFFAEHAPHARQAIAARMLETARKGYWAAADATRARLAEVVIEETLRAGVACDHLACDDPELTAFVVSEARRAGSVAEARLTAYAGAVEAATGAPLEARVAERTAARARWHDPAEIAKAAAREAEARAGEARERAGPGEPRRAVTGRVLREVRRDEAQPTTATTDAADAPPLPPVPAAPLAGGAAAALLLAHALGWRRGWVAT